MGFMVPSMPKDTAAADEAARQKRITEGMGSIDQTFSGFNPEFYAGRSKAYSDYAMPQLAQQYDEAKKQLTFGLTRQFGNLEGTAQADKMAELERQKQLAESGVSSKAGDYSQSAQKAVEAQRGALVSQLQATADPAAAATASLRSQGLLQAPDSFEPLGNLFSNLTEGLAANAPDTGLMSMFRKPAAGSTSKQPYQVVS